MTRQYEISERYAEIKIRADADDTEFARRANVLFGRCGFDGRTWTFPLSQKEKLARALIELGHSDEWTDQALATAERIRHEAESRPQRPTRPAAAPVRRDPRRPSRRQLNLLSELIRNDPAYASTFGVGPLAGGTPDNLTSEQVSRIIENLEDGS